MFLFLRILCIHILNSILRTVLVQESFDIVKKTRIDEMDMISELPEPILHHILSFLPFKQVARTCVLSKKWEETWRTYPVFKIDESILFPKDWWRYQNKRMKSLNFLEQTLRNRHFKDLVCMEKFSMETKLFADQEIVSFVDRCISYAIGNNVKKLKLGIYAIGNNVKKLGILSKRRHKLEFGLKSNRWYDLPPIVLCAKSIEVLKLRGCKLELPRKINVKLASLRRMHLVEVYSNSHVINNLLAGCPLIEEIGISNCEGIESVELFGLERLIDIRIADNKGLKRVDMKKLNVSSLSICQPLTIPFEINITICTNLKSLRFVEAYITDEWLCQLIYELPLLECLELCHCKKLKSIKISSASLKTFSIFGCMYVVELKIDTLNLTHFTYDGGMIFLCLNALALSNVDLSLFRSNFVPFWNAKFIELLAQFHKFSEMLSLRVSKNEEFIVSKELRQMIPSPLSSCKHLNLRIDTISQPFSIAKVVDELLWIAPHIKTLSIEYFLSGAFKKTSFEFSYKKPLVYEDEISSCGNSFPLSCWQYCIEKVKLEFNDCEGNSTKGYSLEGREFLEKIY
ncbi:hypothetical protein Ddye_014312 [Dipteronia dyeriana]|uniref:F-box domain-containing protein n=1 Tax=Dipteronia dyeriana TaxID=168575 RepID=A0AAD9X856_9ROSI|nr:hypothetical protein Ddye_014312 [Dipteronia dyeriana]